MLDGYAISNTKHVLCALQAYELKAAATSIKADAEQAAIDCYATLSQRRVCGRTVRNWLATVKSYGGIESVPENAFGARKSCPHVARPIRKRFKEIEAEAMRLKRALDKENSFDPQTAMELALIDRDLDSCAANVYGPLRYRLDSIRQLARRLGSFAVHQPCVLAADSELGSSLIGILSRLKALPHGRAERVI
jgi:hypothetical protein